MKIMLKSKAIALLSQFVPSFIKFAPWLLFFVSIIFLCQLTAKNKQLNVDNETLREDKEELIGIIDYKNNQLIELDELHRNNEQQLINQRNQLQTADILNRQYKKELEQLINENEQLREWSNNDLPAAVKRLYSRPEIAGGEDYKSWLSSRNTLLSSSKQPEK